MSAAEQHPEAADMSTTDGLGADGPFRVVLRPQGFAVVSDDGAVLWIGSQRFKARQVAEQRNRELAA